MESVKAMRSVENVNADAGYPQKDSDALSVSAAMAMAKSALESVVVKILGEVSEVSVKPGYKAAYFTVKDSSASLPCMMWNNRYRSAGIELQVGQLIEITGRFSLYAAKGRMNFDVFSVALAGEGDLRLKVANIAKKLKAEGLTDPALKKQLPVFPESIGLVTSPRSAAVHDVLRTLRRRFPVATVYLAGVPVEGTAAAEGIIEGMRCVYRKKPDVILVVRGGGSFEDLMPFNDEALARAIAACPIPVVTGIGHEVDTTIADMVSDFRASTPTGAAEAVSPSLENLQELFEGKSSALNKGVEHYIETIANRVKSIETRPVFADPSMMFASDAMALDNAQERLSHALPTQLNRLNDSYDAMRGRLSRALPSQIQRNREGWHVLQSRLERTIPLTLKRLADKVDARKTDMKREGASMISRFEYQIGSGAARLNDLSPVSTLARGYSISRNEDGAVVRSIHDVKEGEALAVTVADGMIDCRVESAEAGDPIAIQGRITHDR